MTTSRWTKAEMRARFTSLSDAIRCGPYDIRAWRARGSFLRACDYHDLAVGDFYNALLLTDDGLDASGEHHQQALEALGLEVREEAEGCDGDVDDEVPESVAQLLKRHALCCYQDLTQCLIELGALKSAQNFCELGLGLRLDASPEVDEMKAELLGLETAKLAIRGGEDDELQDVAQARRELYPWNDHEPDRYSAESIDLLNTRLETVAPKCVVKAVDLPMLHVDGQSLRSEPAVVTQLGLFAKEDIAPGEIVLKEKSLLAVNNRLHDELCDACSAELPSDPAQAHACDECMTAIFCSQDCLDQASELYHPAVCGNEDFEAINKDVEAKEASDALYGLLLGRAIAMAETQEMNPLDLLEVAYLWGDYSPWEEPAKSSSRDSQARPRTLPWTFQHNIADPLHMLTMLDVDVFASIDRYDFWILNTLLAKFRGVANARMNARTGKPEVAASHFRWCLANHSCAPNVTWEWGGEIKMWARGGAHGGVVKWGNTKDGPDERWAGGLKAGQEILNHYCDIDLPVKQRREWAAGALGGMCMCERCIWEAA